MVALGLMCPYVDGLITSGGFLRDFAQTAEAAGAESLWAAEHVVVAEDYERLYPYATGGEMPGAAYPMPDPLELLSYLAACTSSMLLGTCVMVAPLHSPVVLAKRAATVERLSDGRLRLGLGIGWQKEEYAAVGVPFAGRGRRLEEGILAMRALWSTRPATFEGQTVSFDRLHSLPQPSAPIPIVLGGNSDAAVRRAARVGDGWFPYAISPEVFERQADLLRKEARAAGREESEIEITVWPESYDPAAARDPSSVRRYVQAGASRVVVLAGISRPERLLSLPERIARHQELLAGA